MVLSLGVLALPAAVWFFLRQANPGEDALAVWGLLGVFNVFFFYGFLGYFCSLSLLFLTCGLWLRWLARRSMGGWVLTCAALWATYFTHIFGFLFTALDRGSVFANAPPLARVAVYQRCSSCRPAFAISSLRAPRRTKAGWNFARWMTSFRPLSPAWCKDIRTAWTGPRWPAWGFCSPVAGC